MSKNYTKEDIDALAYHSKDKPGKLEIHPTKPMMTKNDLSLAYSPGVAVPCLEIERDESLSYKYTNRSNMVAVITNGTAVLGLGNIGASAAKPVMEGKAVLFKKFADVDSIDLELDTNDIDKFISAVSLMGPSFGGINLEDIKAPDCFIIEKKLKEKMNIPVFHDDQHGTAIVAAAGLINAAYIKGIKFEDMTLVVNGAGAAAIACIELVKSMGMKDDNIIMCDTKGVVYKGRKEGMNEWKEKHASSTKHRTLKDAMVGADACFGLSVAGAFTKDMVKSMAANPIIFAMANPDPEILPSDVRSVRDDAIVATGRSDFANQVNNVLCFPFIFRGALDVLAKEINYEMMSACAKAIALHAREDVPSNMLNKYSSSNIKFGKDYIIPSPLDPRLIEVIAPAVAKAAMDSGAARMKIEDFEEYKHKLKTRFDPMIGALDGISNVIKGQKRKIAFTDGENELVIRAALTFKNSGFGDPILIGESARMEKQFKKLDVPKGSLSYMNAKISPKTEEYINNLHKDKWRNGLLKRDAARAVNRDRVAFASSMLNNGDVDGIVLGLNKTFNNNFADVLKYVDTYEKPIGIMMIVIDGKTIFITDTVSHASPDSKELANIAKRAAEMVESIGITPRVAFTSFSNFGSINCRTSKRMRGAVKELDKMNVDFEYDGEMVVGMALNNNALKSFFPHSRLKSSANILVMSGVSSANISARLVQEIGKGSVLGPIVLGFKKPVQVAQINSTENEIINFAMIAAYKSIING